MLDDFKSVIQWLGALRVNGDLAMLSNSMNLILNGLQLSSHCNDSNTEASKTKSCELQHISGQVVDDGDILMTGCSHERRKQSMTAHAVGRLSQKIRGLPSLPFRSR